MMALAEATLATEIENMVPSLADATTILAQAYGDYMKGATANAVPISSANVDSIAVPAMAGAMSFSEGDTALQGATVVSSGLSAFWAAMVGVPASFFTGATLITPAIFTTLAAAMAITFADNADDSQTLAQSAAAMAGDIHPLSDAIGTATIGGTPFVIT